MKQWCGSCHVTAATFLQEVQGCVEGEKAQDAQSTERREELLQKHEQATQALAARLEQQLEVSHAQGCLCQGQ